MTAIKPSAASSNYVTGLCSSGLHERCRGAYGGVTCGCPHHDEPVTPDPAALFATVTHSAGVASVGYSGKLAQAVCSCGWTADEPRRRNHDAFDDARAHLAATAGQVAV